MPRISDYSEAPYQGVSQAPAQVRLKQQAEVVEDTQLSIPQGAEKRAPFEFLCKLTGHPGDTDGTFALVSSEGVNYALTLTEESGSVVPRLYDLSSLPLGYSATGLASESITVTSDAQDYLDEGTPTPSLDFSTLTVEDFTFILNRQMDTAKQSGTAATRPFEALLFMRQGTYARPYSVTVDPVTGSSVTAIVTTPNGKDASDGNWVDTDVILAGLKTGSYPYALNGASVSGALDNLAAAGFTLTQLGPVLYISHPTNNFTVTVADGQAGTALTVIKDKIQAFSDLPKRGIDGFKVRIGQQSGTEEDDFYVKFSETAGPGTGVWEETLGSGSELGLDALTLPVGLVFELGAWTLKALDWQGRLVGDETLAPDPDFVGKPLEDITFWKGRLGLVSSEGVTFSAADDPFKLYPRTLSTKLASDTVSLLNPFAHKAFFKYAIAFERKLILWGNTGQAQVTSGQDVFTPDTADIDEFSTYEFATTAPPQGSNSRLYFLAPRGINYSSVFEMDINQTTSKVEGDDLTVSVPRYIPAGIDRVANCQVNYQMVYGKSGAAQIVPHLFRYAEKQRVQNAWSKWNLPPGYSYGGGFFVNTSFYFLACKSGSAYLLKADLSPGNLDPDPASRILTRLDFRASEDSVQISYDAGADETTLTTPFPLEGAEQVIVRAPGGIGGEELSEGELLDAPEGTEAEVLSAAGTTLVLRGDWTQAPFWVGKPYTKLVELSKFYARDGEGQPYSSERLSLRPLILELDETAYLKVRVTVGGRTPKTYTFEGSQADDPSSVYNEVPLYKGPWRVPIKGSSQATKIELINDSPFPSRILGYTWEGEINLRATRGVK